MSKAGAIFSILFGIFLSSTNFPTQSKILVDLCSQEAIIGWISPEICLIFKNILFILGLISIIIGIIGLIAPEKPRQKK